MTFRVLTSVLQMCSTTLSCNAFWHSGVITVEKCLHHFSDTQHFPSGSTLWGPAHKHFSALLKNPALRRTGIFSYYVPFSRTVLHVLVFIIDRSAGSAIISYYIDLNPDHVFYRMCLELDCASWRLELLYYTALACQIVIISWVQQIEDLCSYWMRAVL